MILFTQHCNNPVDTGRKLNVHKTPGRLLNVLCMFNLRHVSSGNETLYVKNGFSI